MPGFHHRCNRLYRWGEGRRSRIQAWGPMNRLDRNTGTVDDCGVDAEGKGGGVVAGDSDVFTCFVAGHCTRN